MCVALYNTGQGCDAMCLILKAGYKQAGFNNSGPDFTLPYGEEIDNAEDEYQEQHSFHHDEALTPSSIPKNTPIPLPLISEHQSPTPQRSYHCSRDFLSPTTTQHQCHLSQPSTPRTHIMDEQHQSVATCHHSSKGNRCSACLYAEYTPLAVRRPKRRRVD